MKITITKKLVGYCRVSTDNQKDEGTIQIQEIALKEYCLSNCYDLVNIFKDDGVSGGLEDRPALVEMFSYLESNNEVEGVLIFKLDRLARDLYIQEHLIKKLEMLNKSILSVKEPNLDSNDPIRKAFRQFMGIVAELEKSFITMRMSSGRLNKARKGGYAGGGVAFGYKAQDKNLEIDSVNILTIQKIYKLRRYNKLGLRQIATLLNNEGVATARGGKWHASTVRYILGNRLYKGLIEYRGVKSKRSDLKVI
jgi:site-specific DNA recombinase